MKITKEQLLTKYEILQASNLVRNKQAFDKLEELKKLNNYVGSALTITIKNINEKNRTVIEEFVISDGLQESTIEALKNEIRKTRNLTMLFNKIN